MKPVNPWPTAVNQLMRAQRAMLLNMISLKHADVPTLVWIK